MKRDHESFLESPDLLNHVRQEFSDRPPLKAIDDMQREMLKLTRQKPTAKRIARAVCLSAISTDLVMSEWKRELQAEAIRLGLDPNAIP